MQSVDTIIDAKWVIPCDEYDSVLEDHSIIVVGDRIHSLLPTSDAKLQFESSQNYDLNRHAIVPGFINTHCHAGMTLLRGTAEDMPLQEWLTQYIWRLESKWVDEKFVRDGTLLAVAELIRGGTTCLNDMYFFPEVCGKLAERYNFRVVLGLIVLDFPTQWANSVEQYFEKGLEIYDQFQSSEFVTTMLAPHAPYTVSDSTLERVTQISQQHKLGIHTHIHETAKEITDSVEQYGVRPIKRLEKLGLFESKVLAVHTTQLLDEEIELFAATATSVAHCPKSNLKLGSGICRTADLLDRGVNVGFGTDSAASNNSLNMIDEMRFASLIAKGTQENATVLSVHDTLRMATINGAKCLGLEVHTGSLEAGKLADITAIELININSHPVYSPVAQIVHSAAREQVTDVWIGGTQVLDNRRLTLIDEHELEQVADDWQQKISIDLNQHPQ